MGDLPIDELVNIYNDLKLALCQVQDGFAAASEAQSALKNLLLARGDIIVEDAEIDVVGDEERAVAGGNGLHAIVNLPLPPPPRRLPPKPKPRPKVHKAIHSKVAKRGPPKEAADKPAKRGRPRKAADGDKPAKAAKPAKADKPAKAKADKPAKAVKAVAKADKPAKAVKAVKPKVVHPPGKDHPRYNLKLMLDYKAKFLLAAGKPQGRPPAAWKGSDEEQDALRLLAERNP